MHRNMTMMQTYKVRTHAQSFAEAVPTLLTARKQAPVTHARVKYTLIDIYTDRLDT